MLAPAMRRKGTAYPFWTVLAVGGGCWIVVTYDPSNDRHLLGASAVVRMIADILAVLLMLALVAIGVRGWDKGGPWRWLGLIPVALAFGLWWVVL